MRYILFILFIVSSQVAPAQYIIRGKVVEKTSTGTETIPGVNITIANASSVATTDVSGNFNLNYNGSFPITLISTFVGYNSDTLVIQQLQDNALTIHLQKSITLKEVNIKAKKESTSISTMTPINTTTITQQELVKAACCNLSESFETNPTVDVNFTDAVTGAKQIQMLGLDGIYTQIQSENIPLIRGLSSAYGLSFTPGPWIESIQINKGVGSVINGYESITGQLNIELKKPQTAAPFFVNGYINNEGRDELNLQFVKKINNNVSSELLLHGSMNSKKIDHNDDGFLDQPLAKQINAYHRWHFSVPNKLEAQIGVRALYEKRTGGQTEFDYDRDYGKPTFYGVGIENKLLEVFTKTGTINVKKPYKSFALITSSRLHLQDNFFGLKTYTGDQRTFYANTIYQTVIKDTRQYVRTGVSFNYSHYAERFNGVAAYTNEIVPGAYAEYTYNDLQQWAVVAGLRADYLNDYRAFVTPRLHVKYNFNQLTSLRVSSGTGWRTARVYAENSAIFPSSRAVIVAGNLKPEEAWNNGINFTRKFRMFTHEAVFNADYYFTTFKNQVVVDMEDVHSIQFYNLSGKSYAHYIQAELNFEPARNLSVRLGYKYNLAKTTYHGELLERPLLSRDKGLINLEYKTENKEWSFDYTAKYNGKSRLPSGGAVHHGYEIDKYSKTFITMNAQVTRTFKNFDVYAGVENITDFTQHHAIVAPEQPYGDSFDASLVWGPLMGRSIYLGFRYTLH